MNDSLQDKAALYALGLLEGEESRAFELAMAKDPDLQAFVAELSDTTAELALTLEPVAPPAHLKAKIMEAIVRSDSHSGSNARMAPARRSWAMAGWGIAAAVTVSSVWLFQERQRLTREIAIVTNGEAEARAELLDTAAKLASIQQSEATLKQQIASATQRDEQLNRELADAKAKATQLAGEIAGLLKRNYLAEMQISTLQSTVDEYKQGVAVVVWDSEKHEGILKLEKMPPIDPQKDYQLWVVDPKNPAPVSAGVVSVDAQGFAKVDFKPVDIVSEAAKFALSVEQKGGVDKVAGPIVLISP